jgi:hypothetical protein
MASPRLLKCRRRIKEQRLIIQALHKEIMSLRRERFLLKRALVWADEAYMGTSSSPFRIAWHERIDCLEIHK